MKASFTFKLPEEQEAMTSFQDGPRYRAVLLELDEYLRQQIKYMDRSDNFTLEEIRDKIYSLLNEENVSL